MDSCMNVDRLTSTATIEAAPDAVFDVLTDPSSHSDIDGTGWVRDPLQAGRLDHQGQVFRMAMHHERHPDKDYQVDNQVSTFQPGHAIAWNPGELLQDTGEFRPGGWNWRYDLKPVGDAATEVTLTYDWSEADAATRDEIAFPPFEPSHLDSSLQHLARLATRGS
jgi:hypothetical protein